MDELEQMGPEGRRVDEGIVQQLNSGFKYFGNQLCPFANRAWWALLEKGLDTDPTNGFDYIHIDLGKKKPTWYTQVNPSGTVPCIYYNGRPIFESAICVEWIDEQFPSGTKLFPEGATDRANVRFVTGRFGEKVVGPLYSWVRNRDPSVDKERREKFLKELKALNDLYAVYGSPTGPYFLGDKFSYAEICIMPFVYRFHHVLQHTKGINLFAPEHGLDRIKQAFDACQTRPAFQRTSPSREFVIQGYSKYADPVPSLLTKHKGTIVTSLVTAAATAGVAALLYTRLNK